MPSPFKHLNQDLPASVVVFFVAVPLCLGIALASGAPMFAGIIAGIVGGIVVGFASGSALGVSGPAAGLAVIVLGAIASLGSWDAFLAAVVIAGALQLVMGFAGLGGIAYYFPSSVIKGMLAGIGLLIIIKQVPLALGMTPDADDALLTRGSTDILETLQSSIGRVAPGALFITTVSMLILVAWEQWLAPRFRALRVVPGPLAAVAAGIVIGLLMGAGVLPWSVDPRAFVAIPVASTANGFLAQFSAPDPAAFVRSDVWVVALVLAVVASIETLLCVEATDRLDPEKRITPTNRELKAQGLGNIVSGLIGGLPLTQVIVRSSANITFGAQTKLSTILHGMLILVAVIAIPGVLNLIPLATLASVLILVGYKLAKPSLFAQMWRHGWEQSVPFVATVAGILATDLLRGIGIGLAAGVAVILHHNLRNPFTLTQHAPDSPEYRIRLAEEVSFLNKGRLLEQLQAIPRGSRVVIDGTQSKVVDFDVVEILREYLSNAPHRDIAVQVHGLTLDRSTT